jgi:signal transduction histidine kinase/DNA-binding response OmpR family regulator
MSAEHLFTPQPLRVLLIEDDDADAALIKRQLVRAGWEAEITRIATFEELSAVMEQLTWDIVIVDYILPGFDGLIATRQIRARNAELPIVMLSGMAGEELAVQAMQAGAQDYLLKARLERLGAAIHVALECAQRAHQARAAMEALAESEARLRRALEAASMVVWEWDVQRDVVRWTGAAIMDEASTHGELDSVEQVWAMVHEEDRPALQRAVNACLVGALREFSVELRLVHGAKQRWAAASGKMLYEGEVPTWRLVGTLSDVTQRKALERQLAQSQNLEGLGRLASGIAHDFNNLLTILMGYLNIAQLETRDSPQLGEVLEPMREATLQAAALTRQLLGFARRQHLHVRPIAPDELLQEAAKLFQSLLGESIELELRVEAGCGLIRGDLSQLLQVLLTLIINARNAMPDGGVITLSARPEVVRAFTPELPLDPGSYTALAVTDQGCGIAPELLHHLFEPFYGAEGQGTGLGLATAHGIVAQHGGAMHAASTPGQGATLTLYLPCQEPAHNLLSRAAAWVILVVDSNAAIHQLVEAILQATPHQAHHVRSAAQALELTIPFDVLLVDRHLPDHSADALIAALRARSPTLHVLIMESEPGGTTTEDVTLLAKPFTAQTFLEALDALDARRAKRL